MAVARACEYGGVHPPRPLCSLGEDYRDICRQCLLDRFETLALKHFHFGDVESLREFKKTQVDGK